jgi:hypothetical protein
VLGVVVVNTAIDLIQEGKAEKVGCACTHAQRGNMKGQSILLVAAGGLLCMCWHSAVALFLLKSCALCGVVAAVAGC